MLSAVQIVSLERKTKRGFTFKGSRARFVMQLQNYSLLTRQLSLIES